MCAAETVLLVTLETGKDWWRRSFLPMADVLGSTKFRRAWVMEAMPPSAMEEPFSAASPSRCTTEAAEEIGVGGKRDTSVPEADRWPSPRESSGGGVGTAAGSLSTITREPDEAEEDLLVGFPLELWTETNAGS